MEMNSTRKIKEPLFHITKKDNVPLKRKILVGLIVFYSTTPKVIPTWNDLAE